MHIECESFGTGWIGLSIALRRDEIDQMILLLQELKRAEFDHFHLSSTDSSANEGVADIEVTTQGEHVPDNMRFG